MLLKRGGAGHIGLEEVQAFNTTRPILLFIPDISGFTNFIKNTDVAISKKFTHQLLEVILDSNLLNFKVAEIQGDAIFFYSFGPPPCITKLECQVKKTFLDFQKALHSIMEKNTLYPLSLKMVVHYGEVSATEVKGIPKLLGTDIILAHRLLKNNIKSNEYILLTDSYLKTQDTRLVNKSFLWGKYKKGKKSYDYIGQVHYNYVCLSPLKEKMFGAPAYVGT